MHPMQPVDVAKQIGSWTITLINGIDQTPKVMRWKPQASHRKEQLLY